MIYEIILTDKFIAENPSSSLKTNSFSVILNEWIECSEGSIYDK